jgi:hypothetical protein
MDGDKEHSARSENPAPLFQSRENLVGRKVDDRVEGHDAGPGIVVSREPPKVALVKWNPGIEALRPAKEPGRQVHARDRHAAFVEVPGHVTGAAPKFPDRSAPGKALGVAVEKGAVEGFVIELLADAARVFLGNRIVTAPDLVERIDGRLPPAG